MLILSATNPSLTLNYHNHNHNHNHNHYHHQIPSDFSLFLFPRKLTQASPKLSRQAFVSSSSSSSAQHPGALRRVSDDAQTSSPETSLVSSASAIAAAIRRASTSPVEFSQRIEADPKSGLVLPSADFQRLCVEQLDLFRRIVDPNATLSVYVRPAGSYVMDRLELRGVTAYPGVNVNEVVILVGCFSIPAGLRSAEAVLSNQQVEFVAESKAAVFPMVKHPFVVGFLVAEFRSIEMPSSRCDPREEPDALPLASNDNSWNIQPRMSKLTTEQRSNAVNISRSLAMAYVMDQKAMLLQQSSWQNNVRMNKVVEQIRGPLSSIRILSRLLSRQTRKGEIAYDIAEDLLIQGDHIRDTLEQLQDAVYVTKANIVRHNEENLKKLDSSTNKIESLGDSLTLNTSGRDLELPMPPPQLAPLRQNEIRPCNVSGVLADLVGAIVPLARKQKRHIKLSDSGQSLRVAIEEPALRQALSNLIEGALLRTQVEGKVEIVCMNAPAGGALVIIDDDGPDMHYMTQMHSLTPFGAELCLEEMVEDNMTWNFVAGLTVAREILESYGCVVRIVSPRIKDAALGAGGTRVELWLPCFTSLPDFNASDQML